MRTLLLLALTACTTMPELDSIESEAKGGDCTSSGCGDNGGVVDGSDISWFQLDHTPYNNVRFLHFASSQWNMNHAIFADLDVLGNILRWRQGSGSWNTGLALVGTVIRVNANGRIYDIQITEVHQDTPYWTQPLSGFAESYRFLWTALDPIDPTRERGELCPMDVSADPLWNHAYTAVVFEGEKYDNETHDIMATSTTELIAPFNIACFGSLPAKQELSRRTAATVTNFFKTTVADDRQNLARAWAAEYCGGGKSFTHQGHKLRIRDRHHWLSQTGLGWTLVPYGSFHYEAVWAGGRAVCLDTPRMAMKDPTVPADAQIYENIIARCGALPPRCSDQSWFPRDWEAHGDFLTATIGEQEVFP